MSSQSNSSTQGNYSGNSCHLALVLSLDEMLALKTASPAADDDLICQLLEQVGAVLSKDSTRIEAQLPLTVTREQARSIQSKLSKAQNGRWRVELSKPRGKGFWRYLFIKTSGLGNVLG
ncbi:MAG: hypothetical protein HY986_26390 [Candidatus Melainabacteria bacterium]|nr:hypothetical protein [Candidatus Melainabacteria bacterium]